MFGLPEQAAPEEPKAEGGVKKKEDICKSLTAALSLLSSPLQLQQKSQQQRLRVQ